ncbi:hypothetical protein BJX63DRAFT_423820 [Aspergillus granulosus]|uniref:Cation-transporting ATPase n=1 Tax=Aspergillus granulosus TaxID=176169 RepID=A0ABR4H230_9EURO
MEQSPYSVGGTRSPELTGITMARRRDSIRSSYSVATDVGMARSEVFDGPISESIPSSIASFTRRRVRRDSTTSFARNREDEDTFDWRHGDSVDLENGVDDLSIADFDDTNDSTKFSYRSRPSFQQRSSVEDPLLPRRSLSVGSADREWKSGGKARQEINITSEDVTIVVTGFTTTTLGVVLYYLLCALTLGFAFLLFRWFPRWRIRLLGRVSPLNVCNWVVVEDQWKQFSICEILSQSYNRPLSTIFADSYRYQYDEDSDPTVEYLRYFDYRYLRFFYHPLEDKFLLITGWKDPSWVNAKSMRAGLDAEDRDSREQIFGLNAINIQQKPLFQLLVDEAFHPFYIFQLASLVLWSLDEYYYYAACIFIISVVSIGTTVVETNATMSRLKEMSHFECDIRVLRNGFWRSVTSQELVPGDVFEFSDPSLIQVPCDCILLSGDCIVNESMLTGESVPVSKTPLTDDALDYLNLSAPSVHPDIAKHFLFNGTRIIRARRPQGVEDDEAIALAIVMRTGFLTTKGALIRSMLFPKPSGFKFYRDSFRYISVMGVIALLGFIASFVNFVRLGLSWRLIIVRALDLITIVVPPALPATLTIGTNFALSRLKSKNIFCISPQRVNVGGKLDVVCFDKTGTLTEDGLDVLGLRIMNKQQRLSELVSDVSSKPPTESSSESLLCLAKYNTIVRIMATCHSLRVVDDELLGDPLDVKMFEFTGWSFEEGGGHALEHPSSEHETIVPSVARPPGYSASVDGSGHMNEAVELGILRSFEFVSQLRRASVIVRQFGNSGATVFVKGAPESIKDICLPESLPPDFEETLSHYTHNGYRVIACAAKYEQRLSWMKIQKMTRSDAESHLEFVGFIIFENKLKPTSSETITELNRANIRNIMCTGDNILTAVSVARECGIIGLEEQVYIPHFVEGHPHAPRGSLSWESVSDPNLKLDSHTLMPSTAPNGVDLSIPGDACNAHKYSLAVSGDVFRWILDFEDEIVVKRMLVRGNVFARMSPDEKHELVEKLQSLDYCCGFCGDGANDCGALKAADVGISLSDAEASVAAPFTSRQFDVSCVPTLIREGRSSLVTSFCCFKYMSLYSAIQFASVSFLYTSASNLGDFQFLFIDLALILPIAIFMGWTAPYPILSRKRPTADLVSRKVLTPLLGQITICVLIQLVAYKLVQLQPWFRAPDIRLGEDNNIENSENTVLFLISTFQYVLASVVLSVGPPFRNPMRSNTPFLITIVLDLAFSCYMLYRPSEWVKQVMQLTYLSDTFATWLLGLALGSFLLAWLAERKLFPQLARIIGRVKVLLQPGHQKQRRQYKVLLEEMGR